MKNPFSHIPDPGFLKNSPSFELAVWLFVHISIPLLLLFSLFFAGPLRINTSLFDMLPKSSQSKAVMKADAVFSGRNGREIIILACADTFHDAKNGAVLLYGELCKNNEFESVSFYYDSDVIREFSGYLYDHRYTIAGSQTLSILENGGAQEIAFDALASAFGAFNFVPLENLEGDPFLLAERRMQEFLFSSLFSGNMTLKDDVLAAEIDGAWYILMRITLVTDAVTLKADRNVIGRIYAVCSEIKDKSAGLEFYFSGMPFHSYESSSGAQKEVSLISAVTLIIILLLFLYTFRSPLPVIFSIVDIGISLGLAAAAALLFFREIHIITFVFGTTLIGTCVDYSVHFFIHWKKNPLLQTGAQIRSHILKKISICFISTEICFFAFFFAPFPIFRQFALFSMTGLLSSFLTAYCIFPRLKVPPVKNIESYKKNKNLLPAFTGPVVLICLIIIIIFVIGFNFSNIKIENNISSLYTMSDNLMESEKRAAAVLDYGSPGWYFIVEGGGAQETLENEERLVSRLKEEALRGNSGDILATSVFVPSVKTQQRTYEAMKALLPLAEEQFFNLGFPSGYADNFKLEFASSENYCSPENAPSQAGVSNLWIGETEGKTYTCVLPLKPSDEAVFRAIAEEFDNVYFINKAKDIGRDLDTLTRTMLGLFLAAYVVIAVIIFFIYPLRTFIKIISVPLFQVLSVIAALAANGIPIGFFSAAALVLVFGLGLDYIFYMTDAKKAADRLNTRGISKKIVLTGVVLSFLTTILSFGALSLSSFMPVYLFGITVSSGLGAAFIFTILLQSREI
ncbi:MAG: MMPL family transporter [Treponema sp.]|jgi:predicted exporter|nr:MMPL family transporter [Treponema sp.]